MDDEGRLLDWYVVATKPQNEGLASRSIARLGFSAYGPTMPVEVRSGRQGGTAIVQKPIFPHYLLVPFDVVRDPWTRIASAFGVSRILTTGSPEWRPLRLPSGFVERLMSEMPDAPPAPNVVTFQVDEEVVLKGGADDGYIARIKTLDRRGRCSLLMRILGSERIVHTEVARIAKRRSA